MSLVGKAETILRRFAVLAPLLCAASGAAVAQTQMELNQISCAEAQRAAQDLQSVVDRIHRKNAGDPLFLKKFDAAQQAWQQFADAQLDAIYPAEDKRGQYGSAYGMCLCGNRETLIRDRIRQLEPWVKGTPEGDICTGSRL
jgi:uncharacterized protein YecT (DUF1311 family)